MKKINAVKGKDGSPHKLDGDDIYDLALIMNSRNGGFAERLKARHPDLGNSDLCLCLLLKLGTGNKELALLLDTTESAVRKRKSRLKKERLHADDFETIEDYLDSI